MGAHNQPQHHPSAELLIDYASGAMPGAERAMIAAHLAFCPGCCRMSGACDAIGGALLDAIEPARLPPNLLNRTLAEIDAICGGEPARKSKPSGAYLELPELFRRQLCPELATEPWRKLLGGFGARPVPLDCKSGRIVLLKAPAGKAMPRHKHEGDEWTVVRRVGFSDEAGRYETGDFVACGADKEHTPVAAPREGCICAVLLRGDLRFTGLKGRLTAPFMRL